MTAPHMEYSKEWCRLLEDCFTGKVDLIVTQKVSKLVVNQETYKIPKLMFYMCLYGYSTQQIADTLTKLSKRTYLGNLK